MKTKSGATLSALGGAPLSLLAVLAFTPGPQAVSDLARVTGWERALVGKSLQRLHALGFVRSLDRKGWEIAPAVRETCLPALRGQPWEGLAPPGLSLSGAALASPEPLPAAWRAARTPPGAGEKAPAGWQPAPQPAQAAARRADGEAALAPGEPLPGSLDAFESAAHHPSLSLPVRRSRRASPAPTAAQAWRTALELLRREMPPEAYARWLSGADLVRYNPRGAVFTVQVPSEDQRLWLQDRAARILQRRLLGICDRPAEVRFVAD